MPKPKKGNRLGGSASHQEKILANMASQLFEHGAITTTEAKAKSLRPYAESSSPRPRTALSLPAVMLLKPSATKMR